VRFIKETFVLPDTQRVTAYIALGANLGDRSANLRAALVNLDCTEGISVKAISGFLENPAVGGPSDSPAFLNAVAEVVTSLSAREFLARLLEIERSLGRERRDKWGPRTIDLDILLYGDSIIREQDLVVPHPRMQERRFVLRPLAELAPKLAIPGITETVGELLAKMA
jgi:2-amino-4-hydroxy-6-hydroxymethyldihydropteridine diphosphokinase